MKLVIEIDDGIAEGIIKLNGEKPREIVRSFQATIADAIKNGTPLPKGHGRLIDADKLYEYVVEKFSEGEQLAIDITDAPTIIEADMRGDV